MASQSPSLGTVLQRAIERALREVRTCEPGIVNAYDPSSCTVDVQPLLMRTRPLEDGTTLTVRAPVVNACPVIFVGGGGSRLTFPIKAGDTCLLLIGARSFARWKLIGGEVDPKDNRHHHISDSIAIVGLSDIAHASPAHASATVLEASDLRLGSQSASDAALKANTFLNALTTLLTALGTFAGTCTTVPSGTSIALGTAITNFEAAYSSFKSTIVKIGG